MGCTHRTGGQFGCSHGANFGGCPLLPVFPTGRRWSNGPDEGCDCQPILRPITPLICLSASDRGEPRVSPAFGPRRSCGEKTALDRLLPIVIVWRCAHPAFGHLTRGGPRVSPVFRTAASREKPIDSFFLIDSSINNNCTPSQGVRYAEDRDGADTPTGFD